MKIIKGGITAPKGFLANSLNCGIKKHKHDLALLFSEAPSVSLGVFTQNKVKAAPIVISQKYIKGSDCRAVIINSGNANCCTGSKGINDAVKMAALTSAKLGALKRKTLVASTGVIGEFLPIRLVTNAIPKLVRGLRKEGGKSFAKAILTTDKWTKEAAMKIRVGKTNIVIGGVAKGAGMINPNMATMLSFITTDAAIRKDALKGAFKRAVEKSFNSISVDGTTSTNDCVFILANGLAGNKAISKKDSAYLKFCKALEYVMAVLARKIVMDGEGATKFIHIFVKNAKSDNDAKKVANSVANDLLFKTSVYGGDPNWGRIAAAVGSSGANFLLNKMDITLGGYKVMGNGKGVNVNRAELKNAYKNKHISVEIDFNLENGKAEMLTCDLTKKYVEINSTYTS